MGKQGRMGGFTKTTQGKTGASSSTKKKMVIKPFKVSGICAGLSRLVDDGYV